VDLAPPDLIALRATLESLSDPVPAAAGVSVRETSRASVRCLEVAGRRVEPGTILYIHGGAFCLFRADAYLKMAGHLASLTRTRVVLPDYALPPEHPYPTPLLEVLSVYAALAGDPALGATGGPLVLVGDSAGANLGLACLCLTRQLGLPMPALGVWFSPWVDLTLAAPSIARNRAVDTELDPDTLASCARAYAGGMPLDHPLVSPRAIEPGPYPRLIIQAGEHEILLDDARSLADAAASAGVEVTLDVAAGMQHNYQFWGPLLPAAMAAYRTIAERIEQMRGGS
jgi:acetyl esterase/lipase